MPLRVSLLAKMGSVDVLLYASGIGKQNPLLDEEIELNTIATNNIGMVRVLCHFLNYVKTSPEYHAKRKAHVAVITSVAGTQPEWVLHPLIRPANICK